MGIRTCVGAGILLVSFAGLASFIYTIVTRPVCYGLCNYQPPDSLLEFWIVEFCLFIISLRILVSGGGGGGYSSRGMLHHGHWEHSAEGIGPTNMRWVQDD